MSRAFSDTTNLNGLVQLFEDEIGVDPGYISGNTTRLKKFVASVNSALDSYWRIALSASGKWQMDDSNHTKYPIIKTDIVASQRNYVFTTDEQSNLILDIYKVAILPSATATEYQEIKPVDQQSDEEAADLLAESSVTGIPYQYDKTANGIFLDPLPSYSATRGLKVYINREASYFTTSDTSKKPGVPGVHHDYFYLRPAMEYARKKSLASYTRLAEEVVRFEGNEDAGITGQIKEHFGRREKDTRPRMTMRKLINFR